MKPYLRLVPPPARPAAPARVRGAYGAGRRRTLQWYEGIGATRCGDSVRVLLPGERRMVPLSEVDPIASRRAVRAIEIEALRTRREPTHLARQARRLRLDDEHVDREQYERAIELSFIFEHPREELERLITEMNATTLWLFLSRSGPFARHAEEAILRRLDALRREGA